jgi:hypothetical protein
MTTIPNIAPLQSFVAARLYFDDLLEVVVPGRTKLEHAVQDVRTLLARWSTTDETALTVNRRSPFERFATAPESTVHGKYTGSNQMGSACGVVDLRQ